jgi:hypothetical protein
MRYQAAPRPGYVDDSFSDCRHPERATGIEPALRAWKALVQPLHHARAALPIIGLTGRTFERGSQDSNLESPVLETGAFVQFGHCPRRKRIVAGRERAASTCASHDGVRCQCELRSCPAQVLSRSTRRLHSSVSGIPTRRSRRALAAPDAQFVGGADAASPPPLALMALAMRGGGRPVCGSEELSAGGGTRTPMGREAHQDLNLARVPIPPRPRGYTTKCRAHPAKILDLP